MEWDILARGLVRYTLPAAGVAGLLVYALGGAFGLILLVLGVFGVVLSLSGNSGTGTAAAAIEPASGVNVTPSDFATKPIGSRAIRAFFWAIGVVAGAILGLVVA